MAQEREENASNIGNLTVKVDVDADDAIKTLKALQRHARETTQVLREAESVQPDWLVRMPQSERCDSVTSTTWTNPKFLAQFTTQQLADELAKREGVDDEVIFADTEFNRMFRRDITIRWSE